MNSHTSNTRTITETLVELAITCSKPKAILMSQFTDDQIKELNYHLGEIIKICREEGK